MPDPRRPAVELYAALNRRDFDRCASLLDADVVATFDGSTLTGRVAVIDHVVATVTQIPSLRMDVEVLAQASDLVVIAVRRLDVVGDEGDRESGHDARWPSRAQSHEILRLRGARIAEIISSPSPAPGDPWRIEAARVIDEQAALRRVAELVAHDATPVDVLEAVVTEASGLVGVAFTMLLRFGSGGATEVVAIHDPPDNITVGMRAPGGGDGSAQRVWRTGRPARVDRLGDMSDRWPRLAASRGYSASAAAPILVEDRLWGALVVCGRGPLPSRMEEQLSRFAELAGTTISGSQARADLQALADEQAALRRVAELVARDAEPQAVLDAVVNEASSRFGDGITALMRHGADGVATVVAACGAPQLLGVRVPLDSRSSTGEVARTGRPSRTDDYATSDARELAAANGVAATVSVPVTVEGALWGSLTVASADEPLPEGLEDRIAQFAGLVGTAVSSAHARERVRRLADEQAALRRVAELVARGVDEEELFASVAVEASRLIDGWGATLVRLDGPAQWTVVATHGGPAPVGTRLIVRDDDQGVLARVAGTGRPARLDDYSVLRRTWARDDLGVRSSVGVPIFVSTRLWGVLGVTSPDRPLPAEAEQRLEEFAGLITAALANAQARTEVQALADEQAGLVRVAERVARGGPPDEVFATVALEAQRLLGGVAMTLTRFEADAALVVISRSGGPAPPGTRIAYESDTLPDRVRRTARPVRVDDYSVEPDAALAREFGLAGAVAAPIVVEASVWGMLTATSADGAPPVGIEDRLQRFANLVGTAVANATSRAQLVASRARVLSTADLTRRRLQRDLHDGAQQRLVQTVISLKLARQSFAEGDVPAGVERVDEGLRHAERATAALRELVTGILPAGLTRSGLRGGVDSLVSDLSLPVDVAIDVPRLPEEIETTAYFVVAEALTNVVKHARAERAWVVVAVDDGAVRIEVGDDGVGGARAGHGSGLTGLFDRVEARGGRLRIRSPGARGTTVEATVPIGDVRSARPGLR